MHNTAELAAALPATTPPDARPTRLKVGKQAGNRGNPAKRPARDAMAAADLLQHGLPDAQLVGSVLGFEMEKLGDLLEADLVGAAALRQAPVLPRSPKPLSGQLAHDDVGGCVREICGLALAGGLL